MRLGLMSAHLAAQASRTAQYKGKRYGSQCRAEPDTDSHLVYPPKHNRNFCAGHSSRWGGVKRSGTEFPRHLTSLPHIHKKRGCIPWKSLRIQPLCLFGRDDPTRTDDPYVPNVVRYQLRYIPRACLSKLVDVNCYTTLKVCSLVLVNNTDLGKFINH